MKVWKKNMVAAAILVTVCAGIYVNWVYTEDSMAVSLTDTLDSEKVMSEDMSEIWTVLTSDEKRKIVDSFVVHHFKKN